MKDRQYINGQKKKRQTGINKNLQKKNSRSSNTAPFKTLGWIQVLQRNGGSNILGMKVKTDIRSWLLKFLVMGRWVMGSNTSHFLCKLCVILSQDLQFLVVSDSHYKKTVLDTLIQIYVIKFVSYYLRQVNVFSGYLTSSTVLNWSPQQNRNIFRIGVKLPKSVIL